jgi:hypothetical protein
MTTITPEHLSRSAFVYILVAGVISAQPKWQFSGPQGFCQPALEKRATGPYA